MRVVAMAFVVIMENINLHLIVAMVKEIAQMKVM